MFTMRDHLAEVERRRDEVVQAERERTARLAMDANGLNERYQPLLAGLGVVLESCGRFLRTRYSETAMTAPEPG